VSAPSSRPTRDQARAAGGALLDASAPLLAPVAVRTLDLEAPLGDLRVRRGDPRAPYRSLLVLAQLGGDPLGIATFSLADGAAPTGDQLAEELGWRFAAELREARTRRERAPGGALSHKAAVTLAERRAPARAAALPAVSVVVATCANPRALERCVRSILACDYDEFELIVVENRPGAADTQAMLASRFAGEPRLRYAEEPRRGASRARNAGLALAEGAIVAFTDDDVVVDRGWIRASVEALRRADDIACVTGLILPLELESESQVLLEQFAGFGKGFRAHTYRHPESRAEIPFFPYAPGAIGSGASTVIRADVARELGGFDTDLGPGTPTTGGEDLELYIRLLCAGHAVSYEPGAIVWHQHPDGDARLRRQVYRYGVGLGAVLAKQLILGPERRGLLRAVPAGIRYARDPKSRKNAGKPPDYPRRLTWLERLGMLVGPAAYVLSARATLARRVAGLTGEKRAGPIRTVRRIRVSGGDPVTTVWFEAPPTGASARTWRADAIALAAAVACIAAAVAVALGLPAAVRAPAVLALMCLAPGTAFVTAARGRIEPGLVLGVSLGSTVVLAQTMLWLGAWWPRAVLYALCGACLLVLAPSLVRLSASRPAGGRARAAGQRVRLAAGAVTRAAVIHAGVILVALLCWAASLLGTHLDRIGGLGLLQAMPPTYFLAFALLLVGFAAAAGSDERDPRLLGCYVLALIVVIHATTAVLYTEPRYAWVYKHLGVINLIASTGRADRSIDIYNNWPSFFAANAWLSKSSGLAPIAYAGWAQLFFNLANVAAVRFALRGVTRDERLLWTASLFFVLGNWVGQDYLSPQAFAFVLSLVVIGLWLRCGPRARERRRRRDRWLTPALERLAGKLLVPRVADDELPAPPLGPRAALLAGGTCFVAVLTSHELSPVILILSVGCLAVFARRMPARPRSSSRSSRSGRFLTHVGAVRALDQLIGRVPAQREVREFPRLWLALVMGAVEVWWVVLAWPFLAAHFSLIQPSESGVAVSGRNLSAALPGAALSFHAPAAVTAAVAVLALVGFVRRLRAGKRDVVPACLIGAPLLGVAFQSYGGEGPYRAYLFALPWLAFIGAFACARSRSRSPIAGARLSVRRLIAVTPVIGAFLLLAYFGQELADRIPADDVAASTWYEQHAPAGSMQINLVPNAPNRLTERYPLVSLADPPSLLVLPGFAKHLLGAADVRRLERVIAQQGHHQAYVVLSQAQENYARLNGLLPSGAVTSFVAALERSSAFRLVYGRPTAWIFEYLPSVQQTGRLER
jgi:GT2 family glycosyltransferase